MASAVINDYTFEVGGQTFGFRDLRHYDALHHSTSWPTAVFVGPLGFHYVPVSAGVGWAIVIGVPLLLVIVALGVRMRLKFLNSGRPPR